MSTQHGYGPVVNGTQILFYEYQPNKAAKFVFVALFGAVIVAHILYSLIILRTWHFIPFILGGICKYAFDIYPKPTAEGAISI